jgi:integrase
VKLSKKCPLKCPLNKKIFTFVLNGKELMATTNFYLKNPNEKEKTLIYLFFSYDGKRLKCSTGESINPSAWNSESQRVRKSYTGASEINFCLDKLEEDVKKIYRNLVSSGTSVTNELIKEKLLEDNANKKKDVITLFSFVEDYIKSITSLRKSSSIVVYKNVLKTLKEYQTLSKKRIDFDTINLDFYNDYSNYLIQQKKFKTNTLGKHIKTLKTFLNEATERGINTKRDYQSKKFKVVQEEIDSIYLNESEIDHLYKFNFTEKKSLEKVRDLFIVGCLTGLRFSDFSQLTPENIENGKIKIRTQKTNSTVIIPVHPRVNEIIEKYYKMLPPAISNQKMNDYLKIIGKEAGIDEKVQRVETKDGKRRVQFIPKYELLTTHTARRSFASNLFKAGFPAIAIMKITGHKTDKAFMKYIRITNEQNAELLEKFWSTKL